MAPPGLRLYVSVSCTEALKRWQSSILRRRLVAGVVMSSCALGPPAYGGCDHRVNSSSSFPRCNFCIKARRRALFSPAHPVGVVRPPLVHCCAVFSPPVASVSASPAGLWLALLTLGCGKVEPILGCWVFMLVFSASRCRCGTPMACCHSPVGCGRRSPVSNVQALCT